MENFGTGNCFDPVAVTVPTHVTVTRELARDKADVKAKQRITPLITGIDRRKLTFTTPLKRPGLY